MRLIRMFILSLPFALLLFGTLVLLGSGKAWPHDALPTASQPMGWAYDAACCSSFDCRELTDGEVSETDTGFTIRRTGEEIAYTDRRVKQSRDEFYHQCTPMGNPDAKRSICLYAPVRGL